MLIRITTLTVFFALIVTPGVLRADELVKVTNKTGGTVRVKVWRGLGAKTRTLKAGKSFTWNRKNTKSYSCKVFRKAGRFVKTWKLKSTKKNIDFTSDINITGKHTISPTRARHTKITNASSKAVVVYLYNAKDNIRIFSKKSYTLQPGESTTWKTTENRFHVKVYELRKAFNKHVATRTAISRPSNVKIMNNKGWFVNASAR